MVRASTQADATMLRMKAQSLKSCSAVFGADTLYDLCAELEIIANTGKLDPAIAKLAQIEVEFARVKQALSTMG